MEVDKPDVSAIATEGAYGLFPGVAKVTNQRPEAEGGACVS